MCPAARDVRFPLATSSEVQEAFHDASHAEQLYQAGLMMTCLVGVDGNVYPRNINLESLTLQAKMRRAQAEIELRRMSIENVLESHNSKLPSLFSSTTDAFCRHIIIISSFQWTYSPASTRSIMLLRR